MAALDSLAPAGRFEEPGYIGEAMGIILCGVEQRGSDFVRVGHRHIQSRLLTQSTGMNK
jgi:hypothetical protein